MDYGLLIAVEVIEALDRLPQRARRKLLDQFYNIRSFPGNTRTIKSTMRWADV